MFYRSLIAFYERNNFSKHPSYRSNKKTTGFADYVYASMCLFSIILGSNLGCRARQDRHWSQRPPNWDSSSPTFPTSRPAGGAAAAAPPRRHWHWRQLSWQAGPRAATKRPCH